jgi:hypothetical protein
MRPAAEPKRWAPPWIDGLSRLSLLLLLALAAEDALAGSAEDAPSSTAVDLLWYREDASTDTRLAQQFELKEMFLGPDNKITLTGTWGKTWVARVDAKGALELESRPSTGLMAVGGTHDGGMFVGSYKRVRHFGDMLDPGSDFNVSKYDRNGALMWEKTFGTSAHELVKDILPLADGGALLAGFVSFKHQKLVRLNSKGQVDWTRDFGGPGSDSALLALNEGTYMAVAPDDSSGRLGCWLFDVDGERLEDCRFTSLTVAPRFPSWTLHVSRGSNAPGRVNVVSQFDASVELGPIELAHTDQRGKILWRVVAPIEKNEPLVWTTAASDITFHPELKPKRFWYKHSAATLPGGDPVVVFTSPNELSLHRFHSGDGSVTRQTLIPPSRCAALYRGLHLQALDENNVVLGAAGFAEDFAAAGNLNKAPEDTRVVSCVWVGRIRLEPPIPQNAVRPNKRIQGDALTRAPDARRYVAEMISATSRLEAPSAKRERTSRSSETEGSPASIFATLD